MQRFFSYLRRNVRRTPYQAIAASMVMFLTFLTLLGFLLLAFGSQKTLDFLESKPQVMAFFKDSTVDSDISAIENSLNKTGKVQSIKRVTKEEAFETYKEQNKDKPLLVDLVTANILPASIEVSTYSPSDLDPIAQMLQQEPVVSDVAYPRDVIENIAKTTYTLRWVGAVVVGFLIVFAILIIVMIIGFKIRIKRTEIEIMRLLGASNWFIRTPFILEGIAYGMTGALLAWIASYSILFAITPYFEQNAAEVRLLPVPPLFMLGLLAAAILISIIIGGLGSYGAVRRYMRL